MNKEQAIEVYLQMIDKLVEVYGKDAILNAAQQLLEEYNAKK